MELKYKVIQTTVSNLPTDVEFEGTSVKAEMPCLVVQLQPLVNQNNNSVIKLVLPNLTEQKPFALGKNVVVTFDAE